MFIPSIASKVVEFCSVTALSNQTQFLEELSNSYWRTPTDTKDVLKMQLRTDCPQGLRLVSGRHLRELEWLIHCSPLHPIESLPNRAPDVV